MASFVRRRHTATSRGMLQPLLCRTYNDNVRCISRGVGFAGGGQFSLLRGRRTSPATTDPTRRPPPPPPLPALDQRRARLVQHQAAGAVEPLPHSPARFAPAPETEALQQGVRRTCCVGRGPPRQGARPPLVQHQTAGVVEPLPHTLVRFAPAPVDGSSTKGSDTDPLAGRVGGAADK